MSRRICVALHNELIKLRPDWYDADDAKGAIKIIMTGSASDPLDWQEHIRNKPRRKALGDRLKDPSDPLKLIIVRDMLLTGYDAPVLNTMYIDKPMNGHNLMQAIARVNRVFGDKAGGLIVDYIGIAQDLRNALATYTANSGRGKLTFDQADAVAKMMEFYEIVVDMFGIRPATASTSSAAAAALPLHSTRSGNGNGFDYRQYFTLAPKDKLNFILAAANHIADLTTVHQGQLLRNGKERFKENVIRHRRTRWVPPF